MARYASDNRLNLKVGVSSFSKDLTSLEVIGRVGINSSAPQNELDVAGSVNISDGLSVSGLTTLSGIVTTTQDLYVGRDLYVKDQTLSGITTITSTGQLDVEGGLYASGVTTFSGVTTSTDTLFANQLSVAGVSTFVGVGTFSGDLYVGGDLYVKDDVVYDEVTGRNLNITGIATVGTSLNVEGPANLVDTFVSGALTATTFTGAGTGLTGITSATNAINIYGGAAGQLLYQAQPGITSAFENGSTNQVLASRGAGNPPQWVIAAPSGAIEGILIFDEGAQVGLGTTFNGLDFRGLDVAVDGGNNGGIATVTISQQDYVSLAGIATNVIGGIASVTQLNVNAGVSSFADFKITSSGVGATVGTSAGITTYYGRGTELSGIVTTITAGDNISINSSTGNVTITGVAATSAINADELIVTGVSTLGIVTGATSIGVVTVYATDYRGDGSNLSGIVTSLVAGESISISPVDGTGRVTVTGLANTANVSANTLVVSGVSTLGIVTGLESLGVTTVYANNIVGGTASFSGNVSIAGTLTYEDVKSVDAVGFVTAQQGINVGGATTDAPAITNYGQVTLSGLSPGSFNTTYTAQSSGFVLDSGTVASTLAQFKSDSSYRYYVADGGGIQDGRILIYSESDSAWVVLLKIGSDFTEGNVSNDDALGSVSGTDSVTTSTSTYDGKESPTESSDIVYASTGGGTTVTGIAITFLADGNGVLSGILTVAQELNVGTATSQFTVVSTGSTVEVGIGTIDPNYNLDVRGTANIEGKLTVNSNTVPSMAMVIALGGF